MQIDRFDVNELYALARDRSTASRATLVATVGDLFFGRRTILSERERVLMTEILRQLIGDVERSVRIALAERLADHPEAPQELVLALANDDIEVAHPILMRSVVLQDMELIEIIRHRTMRHQLSIALRKSVSEAVSDELVATGDKAVVRTLLENRGARISPATLEYIVEQSREVGAFQRPLLRREELGEELAKRMYCWVSAALRKHIVENYSLDPGTLDETIGRTIEELIDEIRTRAGPGRHTPMQVAELLAHANAQTPRFLIELLREGQIGLFEGVLAEMAGLDISLVRRFLYEPGGEPLAICCKAIGISLACLIRNRTLPSPCILK